MFATLLQLAGIVGVIVGCVLVAGIAGAFIAGGCAVAYVGLAAEGRR